MGTMVSTMLTLGQVLTGLYVFSTTLFLAAAMGPTLDDGNEVTCIWFLMVGDIGIVASTATCGNSDFGFK